jgi:Uroporphyrinogen-III decarboxylase
MATLVNDRFLRALMREPVDRTPIWMMRQAGRYLPEYRATREQAGSFLDLCKNTELACEVTMQPLRRYPMDAAILFSDILTIPDALGLGLYFEEGEGPRFRKTVRSEADLDQLNAFVAADDLSYVMDAVTAIRRELNGSIPLIGFLVVLGRSQLIWSRAVAARISRELKRWLTISPNSCIVY